MVGFPGETEQQFQELIKFVQEYPLDNIGMFKFSSEKEAHASTLPDQIDENLKQQRLEKLVKTQLKMVRKRNQSYFIKLSKSCHKASIVNNHLSINFRTLPIKSSSHQKL